MKQVFAILFFILAFCPAAATAQTFTFECVCDYVVPPDCDICNTQVQSRLMNGLLIRRSGAAFKWIEYPYLVKIQGQNAVIQELVFPNPESVTINLSGTGFATMSEYMDSLQCNCGGGSGPMYIAGPGILISGDTIRAVDTSATNEIQRLDTFSIVSGVLRASLLNDGVPFSSVTLPVADGSETKVNAGTAIGVSGNGTVATPYVVSNTADLSVTPGGTNALQVALNTSGQTPVFVKGAGQVTVTESATGDTIKIGGVGGIYGFSDTTQPAHLLRIAAASTLTFQSLGDNFGGVVPFRVKSDGSEPDIMGLYANGDSLLFGMADSEMRVGSSTGLSITAANVLALQGDSVQVQTLPAAPSAEKTYVVHGPDAYLRTREGIPLSHLNQSGAATGQVVKWNGAAWVPSPDTGSGPDSTWAKSPSGDYAGKRITDNVYRTGKLGVGVGPTDTLSMLNLRETPSTNDLNGALQIRGRTNGDSVNIFMRLRSSAVDSTEDFIVGAINSGSISAAGDNTSWYDGHNIYPGGSRINSTKPALFRFSEDNFTNALPLVGNVPTYEFHYAFVPKNSVGNIQSRFFSTALDHLGRTSDLALVGDLFTIKRFGQPYGFRPTNATNWVTANFYDKKWIWGDSITQEFSKNNIPMLKQSNAAGSSMVTALTVDASDRVLLGGANESNVAAYNQLEVTNSGQIFNSELAAITIGKAGLENNLVLDGYVRSGRSGENGKMISYNHDASGSYASGPDQDNFHLYNSNSTSNNWSGISSFGTGGIDAAVGFRHLNHAAATGQVSLFARSAGDGFAQVVDFSPTLSRFYYPLQLRATTFEVGYATTFSSTPTFNNGFTVNTVAPTFNTPLQLGGAVGSKLTVYNDYSSASPASSGDYEAVFLGNRNTTNNNWTAISFNANGVGGGIAADIAAQYTSHSNLYADIVFHTRSTGGYGEVMRVTGGSANPNRVGILTSSPTQPLHVFGNARVTGAYYDSNNDPGTTDQILKTTVTGTDWVNASTLGDNWGGQTVVTTGGTLSGNGTSGSPLQVATDGIGPTQLAPTAVTPGSYVTTNVTVDADGRITAAASGSVAYQTFRDDGAGMTQRGNANFVSTSTVSAALTDDGANNETEVRMAVPTDGITATEIAANAVGASEISSLGTAGTYGSATQVPVFTTDADGRVSAVTNTTITGTLSGHTATRIPFASAANALTDDADLTWLSATNRLSVGNTGGSPSASVHIAEGSVAAWEPLKAVGTVSGNMITTLSNAQNSGGASNSILDNSVGGANAGDPMYRLIINGVDTWVFGVDNSASDLLKIGRGTTPSTMSNVGITMTADATPLVGINNDAPLHPLHVIGRATATVLQGISGTPAHTFGTGAGTGPTLGTITGTSNGIDFQFTTGTAPTNNGNVFSITLPTAFSNTMFPVFCAANAQTATDITKFYISAVSASAFTVTANGTVTASTTYRFKINISGR